MNSKDFRKNLTVNGQNYLYYDIQELDARKIAPMGRLPFSIRILVENLLRKLDGHIVREADLKAIAPGKKPTRPPWRSPTTRPAS